MIQPVRTRYEATGFVDSRIGGRQENQDCAGIKDTAIGLLVVVCDGMGGMQGGQIASTTAVTSIMSFFDTIDKQSDPAMTLIKAINEANAQIIAKSQENPNLTGMGTTVTALLKTPKSAIVAHVGDSRIYQFRGCKKVFRTFDHSMVFEMVKKKVLTEEQARLSVQSNVILKALGVKPDVEVEWHELPYLKGDRFVLCSDGFWGAMPEKDFITYVTKKGNIKDVLQHTANKVESLGKEKGEDYDNLTAAIVDMDSNSKMQVKMNTLSKTIIGVLAVFLIVSIGFNGYQYSKLSENVSVLPDSTEQQKSAFVSNPTDSTSVETTSADSSEEKKEVQEPIAIKTDTTKAKKQITGNGNKPKKKK